MSTLTLDQAIAHLSAKRDQWRHGAADSRRHGEDYKAAANAATDDDLSRVQFEESSRWFGYARAIDRDVEAMDLVLAKAEGRPA